MDFQDLCLKWEFGGGGKFEGEGAKWGKGDAMLTPTNLFFTFGGSYVFANFGRNRSRNTTVRVHTDGYCTDTLKDANRLYNLSHAICYSYGTDNQARSQPTMSGRGRITGRTNPADTFPHEQIHTMQVD